MKKTDAIIIMDGYGFRDAARGNAIVEAGTRRDFASILPAGRYRIAAADETGRTGTAVVELKAGESTTQEIALK